MKNISEYKVVRLEKTLKIDGIWDKPEWKTAEAIKLKYFMGEIPSFQPIVNAKMMYGSNNLYIIFRVEDRYIRCVNRIYNSHVCEDSCVEFFFSPDSDSPEKYFNLEINCGGTPLMRYSIVPRKNFKVIEYEDLKQIEIAHSLPEIIDPEIKEAITWTLEYRIPLVILEKYSELTYPKPGVVWKGNFYKIADKTSNVHYLTWSLVDQAKPDFHLPAYFGKLIFQ